MSKLPEEYTFLDLSDYGRAPARWIANALKETAITPVIVTICFIMVGLEAIIAIYYDYLFIAGLLLIVKSILDAADGELSRVKQTPSYTGRYLDSIADILLNFLFLLTIGLKTDTGILYVFLAFIGIQLQGTLYNYYYVILRNKHGGDTTSRIFETEPPVAMKGETQRTVNIMFHIYNTLYISFDKCIYYLDPKAAQDAVLPNSFMTLMSTFGLGFQLLIIAVLISVGGIHLVIPFFIFGIALIPIIILVRRIIS